MKTYRVKTQFVFEGEFEIRAKNREQAAEYVAKHCGLVIGGDIHSSLPDNMVDWDFPVHPNKKIKSVKELSKVMS